MKKKIMSLALVFVFIMVLFLTPVSALAASIYSDINGHWAQSAIGKWSDLGIVEGWDGKFRPDDPMTRGELAVVIDRVMKYQKAAANGFSDLEQAFYTDAILKANAARMMLGAGNLIHPTDNITREEAAVILARALGVAESAAPAVTFADNALISSWAAAYVNGMAKKGFIHGYDNNFNPKATISRAEIVTILSNAIATICADAKEYTGSVNGTVIVNTSGATLDNMTINGDLIISEGVGNGDVTLHNVIVTGNTIIRGGGPNSIHITGDSHISNIILQKLDDGSIRVVTADGAVVDAVVVDDGTDGIILSGSFVTVTVAADVDVSAAGANIQNLNMTAAHSSVTIDSKSNVITLTFSDAAAGSSIQNNGTITTAEVNANGIVINGNIPASVNVGSNVTQDPTDSSGKPIADPSSGSGSPGGGTPGGGSPGGGNPGGGGVTLVNAAAPVITNDLAAVTTSVGASITLDATATVTDGGTVTYAWYSNTSATTAGGTALTSETAAIYQPNVSSAGTYYYYCVVTNTNSAATGTKTATTTSAAAIVTVNTLVNAAAPVMTNDLADIITSVGASITLDATATVTDGGTVTYAWYSNTSATTADGTALGVTSATYQPDVTATGMYYYYCVVTNTNNAATGIKTATATSTAATVTVNSLVNAAAPVITHDLADVTTSVGASIALDATATVTDGGTVTYAWYSNTSAITADGTALGVTSATYQPDVSATGTYYYYCVVTNTNNAATGTKTATTTSAAATVTVTVDTLVNAAAPVMTHDLAAVTTSVGTAITLDATATVTDGGTVTYAWYSNTSATAAGGTALGVTSATYQPDVSATGTYYYYCVVTNTNAAASGTKTATTTSAAATVTVTTDTTTPPFLDGYPQAANIGSNSFDVLVKADKVVTFYYVAYPIDLGFPAPNADQVIAGNDGANHHTLAVRSGNSGFVTVSDDATTLSLTNLYGYREYHVFIVALDEGGSKSAVITLPVTTLGERMAPVFKTGYPIEALKGSNSADILVQCDEESSVVQYHWIAYVSDPSRADPISYDVMHGTDGDGSPAGILMYHQTGWSSAILDTNLHIANMSASTTYDVFIVAIDSELNESEVAKITVTTRAEGDSAGRQLFVSQFQSLHWDYISAINMYQYNCYLDGSPTALLLPLSLKQVMAEGTWGLYNVALDSTGTIVTGLNTSSAVFSGKGYTADSGGITANTEGTSSTYTCAASCLIYYVDNATYSVTVLTPSGISSDTDDLISVWSSGLTPFDAIAIVITKVE